MHVVIAGCPRSGTSIMGELFDSHPEFKFYFEPATINIGTGEQFGLHAGHRWALKNPIVFPEQSNKSLEHRIADAIERRTPGLAFNIPELERLIPGSRYIWIIRHPLDTVSSLIPGLSDDWRHPPRPVNWNELMEEPVHVRAAHFWVWFNEMGYENLSAEVDLFTVAYEDLVRDTESQVRLVLQHVDAPWTEELETYVSNVTDDPRGYQAQHQSVWSREGHFTHVGRWRDSLTIEQAKEAWEIVGTTAMRHGYVPPVW